MTYFQLLTEDRIEDQGDAEDYGSVRSQARDQIDSLIDYYDQRQVQYQIADGVQQQSMDKIWDELCEQIYNRDSSLW